MEFSRICSSFKLIGLSDAEMKTIFRVLAGIVHLGYASASKSRSEMMFGTRIYFHDRDFLRITSYWWEFIIHQTAIYQIYHIIYTSII